MEALRARFLAACRSPEELENTVPAQADAAAAAAATAPAVEEPLVRRVLLRWVIGCTASEKEH